MRIAAIALFAVLPLLCAGNAHAAQCKTGNVSLTLKLDAAPIVDPDGWGVTGFNATPCTVDVVRSMGKPPADCRVGKTLEASGVIRPSEIGIVVLQAGKVRCF